ncbi:hypothetical protein [Phocaeicola plebeius]|uniref:Uncharacterized protein n=1 Tax=Phocaeicola plebeius TaxID=310297 RepID=A0A921HJC4_9BACT|nr:hypothetical protein [Phocaeicola plebeius]HJF81196.1 hypothetical protein [Phocaeicola plebeius]
MDVIQILVFLGIIGWGLFQARTQKQKKPKRVKTVRQTPPAASFSVEEEVLEEVIPAPVPEARKKRRYTSAKPSTPKEQVLNVPKKEEQKPEIAFRNAADARRAFIYSEIFRRKYD